jgi:hypothetical protein
MVSETHSARSTTSRAQEGELAEGNESFFLVLGASIEIYFMWSQFKSAQRSPSSIDSEARRRRKRRRTALGWMEKWLGKWAISTSESAHTATGKKEASGLKVWDSNSSEGKREALGIIFIVCKTKSQSDVMREFSLEYTKKHFDTWWKAREKGERDEYPIQSDEAPHIFRCRTRTLTVRIWYSW